MAQKGQNYVIEDWASMNNQSNWKLAWLGLDLVSILYRKGKKMFRFSLVWFDLSIEEKHVDDYVKVRISCSLWQRSRDII